MIKSQHEENNNEFVPLLIWMFACGSDNEVRLQKKTVRTELNTYDVECSLWF